jgi:nucleoside-diphosphate-sugar epimerase
MAVVAVTGATGFVGGALLAALQAVGHDVRALVRGASRATALREIGSTPIVGDLTDRHALRRLVDGSDCVVHCAAAVRGRRREDFEIPNVVGTSILLDAVRDCGVPRLLHLSSLAAREPQLSWYSASKRRAERLLADRAPSGLQWCCLRPPAVYGPGDRELLGLWRLARRGYLLVTGNRASRLSFLHVDDLTAALLALINPTVRLDGAIFPLADGQPGGYAWEDLAAVTARIWSRPVRLLTLPPAILRLLARGNLGLAMLRGSQPMLTPGKARELMHDDWVCDGDALSAHCGWRPRLSLEAGLRELDLATGERRPVVA